MLFERCDRLDANRGMVTCGEAKTKTCYWTQELFKWTKNSSEKRAVRATVLCPLAYQEQNHYWARLQRW